MSNTGKEVPIPEVNQGAIEQLAGRLDKADKLLIVTGAGISVASGLDTYSDKYGNPKDPEFDEQVHEIILGVSPDHVWRLLAKKHGPPPENPNRVTRPNPAHFAVTTLLEEWEGFVLTQNVDELHKAADLPDRQLVEVHGNFASNPCPWTDCDYTIGFNIDDFHNIPMPPKCETHKGTTLQPGVVIKGQDSRGIQQHMDAIDSTSLVMFVGTQAKYPYIPALAERANQQEGQVVVLDPNPTPLDDLAHQNICGRAEVVLPQLIQIMGIEL